MTTTRLILLPKQIEALTFPNGADSDYCLYQGGFGAGKTTAAIRLFQIAMDKAKNGVRCLFVSDTLTRLESVTIPPLKQALYDCGFTDKDFRYANGLMTIKPFNSLAYFRGIGENNSLEVLRGLDPDIAIMEEPSTIGEAQFLEFRGRLRGGKTKLRVLLVSNPQDRKSWFHKYFVEQAGISLESVTRKGLDGVEYTEVRRVCFRRIIASSYDNPFLSSDYLAGLQKFDEKTYRMNVLGEDGDYTEGLVCYNFSFINIDDTIEYDRSKRLYLSCDFNADPNCWMVAQRVAGEYHFIDEICLPYSDSSTNAEEFIRRYGDHDAGVVVLGDASGSQNSAQGIVTRRDEEWRGNYLLIQKVFAHHGWIENKQYSSDKPKSNPRILSRVKLWNSLVKSVDGKVRIRINPRCKWLIWNCQNLRWLAGSDKSEFDLPTTREIEQNADLKYTEHPFAAASYLPARYESLDEDIPKQRVVARGVPFVPQRR